MCVCVLLSSSSSSSLVVVVVVVVVVGAAAAQPSLFEMVSQLSVGNCYISHIHYIFLNKHTNPNWTFQEVTKFRLFTQNQFSL